MLKSHLTTPRLVLLAASLLAINVANAAPTITSVSGSQTNGGTLTLSGSSFGTKATAAPKLWDAITNQYSSIADGKSVPVGGTNPYGINTYSTPGAVVFSTQNLRHRYSTYNYRTSNYTGYLQWPKALGGEGGAPASQKTLYVTFWTRPDASVDVPNHSSKFFRVWDEANGNGTRLSWTQMHYTVFSSSMANEYDDWNTWGGNTQQWNRMELYIDANTNTIKGWTNGKLIHNITNFVKDPAYSGTGLSLARIGFDPGGTAPPAVNFTFGEIYADTTQQRVELCASSTWSACTTKEIQIPTAWDDGKISVTVNRGSLDSVQKLYAYVVDASGNANANGFALDGSPVVSPSPPTAVNVR